MEPLEILKWVLIVFIAGFIGYFGKHLGAWIISKFRKNNAKKQNPKETAQYIKETQGMNKYEYKLAKKKLKVKKNKKKLKKSKK